MRSDNPYWRLVAAVCVSTMIHATLLLAVRIGQVEHPGEFAHRLNVRLAAVEQPASLRKEAQPVLVRAIDKPSTVVRSEPAPVSPPQALESAQARPNDAKSGMPEQAAGVTTLDIPLPEDTAYYPAREVDDHPSLVSGGKPVYPEKPGRENLKGEVTVLMMLNEHGIADEVSVVEAKPEGAGFEEAVIAWLRDARFKPAMRKGRAVKARVVYHVTFEP